MPFVISIAYGVMGLFSSFNGYFNLFFGLMNKFDFDALVVGVLAGLED